MSSPEATRVRRRRPLKTLAVVLCAAVLAGCGWQGGPVQSGSPTPVQDLPSTQDADDPALTSDDLFTIYQAAVTGAVARVTGPQLVRGALTGSHAGAVEAGLLPLDSAILDTVRIEDTGDARADWTSFGTAYDAFTKKLGDRLEIAPVGRGAARGMLAVLGDPFSRYLDRRTVLALQSTGEAGIGVTLAPTGGAGPLIREVEANGPAERAGLRPGDVIHAVGDRETQGMDLYDVIRALRGNPGQEVELSVVTSAGQVRRVAVRRALSSLGPASAHVERGVQVIQLRAFESGATQAIGRLLLQAPAADAVGWLIDVRGSGEGSLTEAAGLASLFVGQRVIALEEDAAGRQSPIRGTFPALPHQRPLVVLVDGATAGPGEVLAAAVQEYGVGTVVGTPTAGRLGTPRRITLSDGSAAEITVRRMLSPSGHVLLGPGVSPDVVIAHDPASLATGIDVVRDHGLRLVAAQ